MHAPRVAIIYGAAAVPRRKELCSTKLCNLVGGCHWCGMAAAAAVKEAAAAADETAEEVEAMAD